MRRIIKIPLYEKFLIFDSAAFGSQKKLNSFYFCGSYFCTLVKYNLNNQSYLSSLCSCQQIVVFIFVRMRRAHHIAVSCMETNLNGS